MRYIKHFFLIVMFFLNISVVLAQEELLNTEPAKNQISKESEVAEEINPLIPTGENHELDSVEVKETKYPSGKVWYRRKFINSIQNGVSSEFYENGKVKMEAIFKDGKLDGAVKHYYPSGSIKAEIEHKNNTPNGKAKMYHEEGEMFGEFFYKDGKFEGICKEFYKDGKKKYEHVYENGVVKKTTGYDSSENITFEE